MSGFVKNDRPKLLLVCGTWGGGTTALAGMLAALGIKSPVPLHGVTDERTMNTFESILFREAVMSVVSEEFMKLTVSRADALQSMIAFRDRLLEQQQREGWLDDGKPIFLKYPLSALLIPELCQVFETRLIYVIRPLKDVEASRRRRGWPANAGEKGGASSTHRCFIFSSICRFRQPSSVTRNWWQTRCVTQKSWRLSAVSRTGH
ncbi:MAG: hypothetical protein H8M99_11960 [Gloeobacteraceae cyanobacterium ES-bin-144]|nr:hypothetical protein [Verrucomicrobiales bacterium]